MWILLIILLLVLLYQNKEMFDNHSGTRCQECQHRNLNNCINCADCGYCISKDGTGKCVKGDAYGPYDKEYCWRWVQNSPLTNYNVIPPFPI